MSCLQKFLKNNHFMEAEFCLWGHIMENSTQIGSRNTLSMDDRHCA